MAAHSTLVCGMIADEDLTDWCAKPVCLSGEMRIVAYRGEVRPGVVPDEAWGVLWGTPERGGFCQVEPFVRPHPCLSCRCPRVLAGPDDNEVRLIGLLSNWSGKGARAVVRARTLAFFDGGAHAG